MRPSRRPSHFSSSGGLHHHQMQQQHGSSTGGGGMLFRGALRHPFNHRLPRFQNPHQPHFPSPSQHQHQHHSASISPIRHSSVGSACSFPMTAISPQPFTVQSTIYQHAQSAQQGPSMSLSFSCFVTILLSRQSGQWASLLSICCRPTSSSFTNVITQ